MLALKEEELIAEAILALMKHGQTEHKQLKNKGEITTGTVHAGQIKKTTTLNIPTEEEWWHADITTRLNLTGDTLSLICLTMAACGVS